MVVHQALFIPINRIHHVLDVLLLHQNKTGQVSNFVDCVILDVLKALDTVDVSNVIYEYDVYIEQVASPPSELLQNN